MIQSSSTNLLSLALFAYYLLPVVAIVQPFPVSDCSSSGGIGLGQITCTNQPGCCSGISICCAGGCCPSTSYCVNIGTSNEACCPFSDTSACGAALPSYSSVACAAAPKPSKLCVGVGSDWYCRPGALCGARSGLCIGGTPNCASTAYSSVSFEAPTTTPDSTSGDTVMGSSATAPQTTSLQSSAGTVSGAIVTTTSRAAATRISNVMVANGEMIVAAAIVGMFGFGLGVA